MYGAMIGDIVGSVYEFDNIKTKDFELFDNKCDYTDDTVMTAAVASAVLKSEREHCNNGSKTFECCVAEEMIAFGKKYPNPTGAYGLAFSQWLNSDNPKPYHSWGNGSAMRASACGIAAVNLEEAQTLAEISARVTHNHPEGIKGAKAVASAIFLAKESKSIEEIREYINDNFYRLDETLDEIREYYSFEASCQKTVPQAITAFLESNDFEDAIRNAISIGGDSDTVAAITGSIAWTYYYINGDTSGYSVWVREENEKLNYYRDIAKKYLPQEFIDIADELHKTACERAEEYCRFGSCTPIYLSSELD